MYIFYGHGGSGNHGCEAIVRSSVTLINESIKVFSTNKEQDLKYGLDNVCEISSDVDCLIKRGTLDWFMSSLQTKITGKIDRQIKYRKKELLSKINKDDIYFSIGGDNYCYPGTEVLAAEREIIQKKGAKVVLWGCSVEPSLIENEQIAKDLASYDLITARESISYNALKKVNKNTILVSDPAFTLETKKMPLPEGWIKGKTIGINASPLILQSARNSKILFNAYKKLIFEILDNTDCVVALIPHVVWKENDDREPLKKLYESFKKTGRVILINDCNCMELKGYISQCRIFVGARTHATIAAYSSGVPTLVLGYSVKSKGIALDLFGEIENYVLPVQTIENDNELVEAFNWIFDNEEKIKRHLNEVMPEYKKRAYKAYECLESLFNY